MVSSGVRQPIPTLADNKTEQGPVSVSGAFTSSITGLTAGTLYHVRAYATNEAGTAYGEDVTFTTLFAPTVTTQAVTAITTTTATGNGNVTDLGLPNPTEHGVVWSTTENPTTADSKTTDGPVSATGAFTSNITGLTPGTLYHVRAYATNAVGTSYGEDVTFTTQVAPAVTTLAVSNIGDTTATANGDITSLGMPNPTQYGMVWDTAADPTIALSTKTEQGAPAGTGAFTSSITGLTQGTLYHVRAYVTNAVGTVYGEDVTFTTIYGASTSTPATNAGTGASVTGVGTVAWSNPNRITADDTLYATAALNNATSQYLQGTNYGFAIPANATINGIVVTIGRFENTTGSGNDVRDNVVRLIKGGAVTGDNKADTVTEWPTGTSSFATYGTNSDLWGTTWTPAEINASDFGVALSANSTNSRTASVDYMQIGVTYTVPSNATAPTVTTQAATAITTTTTTGNGTITNLGVPNPTQYGVVWSTSTNPTVDLPTKTEQGSRTTTGAFTSSITGLTPYTLYYVRAYATNVAGTAYGNEVTFTTLGIAPTITTQAVTNITTTTATGNGDATNLGIPNPTQHGVCWATTTNPTTANSHTSDGPVSATGAFTSTITGLTPGTLYHVRAYATNAQGTSYGSDVQFTTTAATVDTFTTSGAGSWTAPAGVTSVTVEVWGGGGKGGSITTGSNESANAGGGGGGYSRSVITVVPGNSYSYLVGAGSTTTADGGDSYFIDASTVMANGGTSAVDNSTTANGVGGAVGVGTTRYIGGNGADGNTGTNYGGGGGSSAGTGANGATATNATGATAPAGGGNGGNGKSSPSGNGTAGVVPGGAGGGAYRSSGSTTYTGGSGANGQVRITYYVDINATTTTVSCGAGTASVNYGSSISCVATVTRAGGTATPTGTVAWTTNGAGSFVTSPCTLSGSGASVSCSVTYTPSSVGAGSHLITANYSGDLTFLLSSGNQTVTVNKLNASVTPSIASKTYGEADPALTGTLTGFLPADGVTATYSRATGNDVGTYPITATLSPVEVLSNYNITYNPADFTIDKKDASVTPDALGKVLGQPDPELTGSLVGFLSADNVTATYSRTAGETVEGSPYLISAVLSPAGVLPNYNITYSTANFTITAPADDYTLTIDIVGNGTVTKDPDQTIYHYGDVVTLTAAPELGWTLSSWTGCTENPDHTCSVTIHSNTTVTATFTQDAYTLTIEKVGNGTVTKTPDQTTYHYGDEVTLAATPDLGWTFGSWSPNVVDDKVTIHDNTTVTATFTPIEYALTINITGNGTVAKDPDKAAYHEGDQVTLTATPDPAWSFDSWSANVVDGKVTIHGDTTVTATFVPAEYTLTIVSDHGTIAKDPSKSTYHEGDVVQLTATADLGWAFASWSEDLDSSNNPDSVTIHGNTTVTANYTSVEVAPSFTSTPVTTVDEDALYIYNITATDPNVGDTLTITATTKPAWLTFTDNGDGTAVLTGTPTNAEVGSHDVVLHVSDGTLRPINPLASRLPIPTMPRLSRARLSRRHRRYALYLQHHS